MNQDPQRRFTLGFVLNASKDRVLLMHKRTPAWQAGRVNGLGGKLEQGETPLACVVREIKEESGLQTEESRWILIGALSGPAWIVDVFAYVYEGDMSDARSLEDEEVEWFDIHALPQEGMSNLPWLIPMILDKLHGRGFERFSVHYPS